MLHARDQIRERETYNCSFPNSPGRARAIAMVDKMSGRALKDVTASINCQYVHIQIDTARPGENSFVLLPFRALVHSQPLEWVWIHDHRDKIEVSVLFTEQLSQHNVVSVHNLINLGHQTIGREMQEYSDRLRAESFGTVR